VYAERDSRALGPCAVSGQQTRGRGFGRECVVVRWSLDDDRVAARLEPTTVRAQRERGDGDRGAIDSISSGRQRDHEHLARGVVRKRRRHTAPSVGRDDLGPSSADEAERLQLDEGRLDERVPPSLGLLCALERYEEIFRPRREEREPKREARKQRHEADTGQHPPDPGV